MSRGTQPLQLTLFGFGLLATVAIAPFRSADESAHVAYGLAVSEGRLPTMNEQVVPQFPGQPNPRQHVANHPPLYYTLIAVPLGLGVRDEHALLGLRAARIETLLLGVAGVLAAASVAMGLRRRQDVAVGTAAITATVGSFVAVSSTVMNDAPAMMFSTVALAGLVRVLLHGLRPGALMATAVGTVGAVSTRASGVPLIGLVAGGLVVAGLMHTRPRWRGLLSALACVLGLFAVCAAVVGWFYARNVRLYGSLTGEFYLPRRQTTLASLSEFLTPPRWYVDFAERLSCGRVACETPGMSVGIKLALGLLWLAVFVGAATGLRRMVTRRQRPSWPMLAVLAVFALLVAALWVAIALHVRQGGAPHPRYLFGPLAVLTLAIAGGLRAVPGGPPGVWLVAGLWAQALMVMSWLLAIADLQHPTSVLDLLPTALREAGVPLAPVVVVLLLGLAAAGLVLASRSILILARSPEPPDPDPASRRWSRPSRGAASRAVASANTA